MTRKFWMASALALALVGGVYAQGNQPTEQKQTEKKKKKKGGKKKGETPKEEAPAAQPK